MNSTEAVWIEKDEESLRLDKLLFLRFPQFSRTYFQNLIETGNVLVNGERVKKRETFSKGDEIEICFQLTPEIHLEPQNIPLDILFEDDFILAIHKPAGMVVHPAPGHPHSTFVNALLYHCQHLENSGLDPLRPGIVHRLDKDTSGVLLAAKTAEAHRALVNMFSQRQVRKTYLAVAVGTPPEGRISAPIKRHPFRRQEMSVEPDGKEAISDIKVIKKSAELSLVEIDLITGRTHQIRVHLKHLKAPVLGDTVYGSEGTNKKLAVKRQLLHAAKVQFVHPFTSEKIQLSAPLPVDMKIFWEFLP
ncbi:MAG: RluA family pseudouridine synthase [Chlamydiae bacterium]|nr:RluA family pseudouridine synthase [Chlamydiota bacterium]